MNSVIHNAGHNPTTHGEGQPVANTFFQRIPKAVYIAIAAVIVVVISLSTWLTLRRNIPSAKASVIAQQPEISVKPQPVEESPTDLFKRLAPAVVRVVSQSSTGESRGQGSGFFISSDGFIVTNYHVIENADIVEIFLDNNARYPLEGVVAVSKEKDIAVLKVNAVNMQKLQPAVGGFPTIGTTVYAIGNPQGLVNTFSRGEVSGLRQIGSEFSLIQCTAPISPGSSGGPLLTKNGEVIGITTCYFAKGQNLNFAVPSQYILELKVNSKGLQSLSDSTGRPKNVLKTEPIDLPRWAKDLPYEARIDFVISASPDIRGIIEGYFKRELRKINNVVLTKDKPQWEISVVAIPEKMDNRIVCYWLSTVVFEFDTHRNPKNPNFTRTSGTIVRHSMLGRGTLVLEEGVREIVVEIEGDVIEKDRELYDQCRELWREREEKK